MTFCNEDAGLQQKLTSAAIPDTEAIICLFVSFSIFRLLVLETKILSQQHLKYLKELEQRLAKLLMKQLG